MSEVNLQYVCGHELSVDSGFLERKEEWCGAAVTIPCPTCCRLLAEENGVFPAMFINVQRISDEMSAFVLELTEICVPLDALLQQIGYAKRARSVDELTPGGFADELPGSVWRKEFWFASSTNPFHVLALVELVKEEAHWLSNYLPDVGAVHYLDFPES